MVQGVSFYVSFEHMERNFSCSSSEEGPVVFCLGCRI